ncbi:DUF6301 family protein [Microbacterium sp. ZW T5_45]|uniref:DUF6301 family protein n=1 Tax=Microbacterium sp. ZW T5_45 TaxID=3378080 RepID=UPI003853D991
MAFWNRKRGRSAESETPQPAPSEQLSAAPAPTWKTIPPTDACDIVDFWFRQAWPLTESEVTELAVAQLGWTTVEEDGESFLNNTVHALSMPDVTVIETRSGTSSIEFRACDVLQEMDGTSEADLGDCFTLLVREAESRWGAALLERRGAWETASWVTESRGGVELRRSRRSVSVAYATPQRVEFDRKAARLGL